MISPFESLLHLLIFCHLIFLINLGFLFLLIFFFFFFAFNGPFFSLFLNPFFLLRSASKKETKTLFCAQTLHLVWMCGRVLWYVFCFNGSEYCVLSCFVFFLTVLIACFCKYAALNFSVLSLIVFGSFQLSFL